MMNARNEAKKLARWYFKKGGAGGWNGDNDSEVNLLIDYIIDAAADAVIDRMEESAQEFPDVGDTIKYVDYRGRVMEGIVIKVREHSHSTFYTVQLSTTGFRGCLDTTNDMEIKKYASLQAQKDQA